MNYKIVIDPKSPNIPALEGSPKQVAWAQDIRAKFIEWANKKADFRVIGASESIVLMSSAKFWITNRSDFEFIRSFCTEQDPEFDINETAVGERVCKFTDPLAELELEKLLENQPKTVTE